MTNELFKISFWEVVQDQIFEFWFPPHPLLISYDRWPSKHSHSTWTHQEGVRGKRLDITKCQNTQICPNKMSTTGRRHFLAQHVVTQNPKCPKSSNQTQSLQDPGDKITRQKTQLCFEENSSKMTSQKNCSLDISRFGPVNIEPQLTFTGSREHDFWASPGCEKTSSPAPSKKMIKN